MLTLKQYFKINNKDTWEREILFDRNVFIQKGFENELCIEITDRNGNSVNIGDFVDITINTAINDIKDIVLNYLFDNYLYNYS